MNNLKAHRIKEGYTQEGMAWKFKISQQRYCNYENNKRGIPDDLRQKFAEHFSIEASTIQESYNEKE